MYYYNRKKEIMRNVILTGAILLFAVISTHFIYYKYTNESNVDYNSESLDIVFHEKEGSKVALTKVTPVTDSVGLTSKQYSFTIKNNLTEEVKYDIKLLDDKDMYIEDECGEYKIDKDSIRVSIKSDGKLSEIYTLSELENNVLSNEKIKALEEKNYTVRIWVNRDTTLPAGSLLHYHGNINIEEE